MTQLDGKRVLVTGGSGFLGEYVVSEFRAHGASVAVPRKKDYDFTHREACARVLRDTSPDVVVHLAARVGGIGANKDNPGLFFFDNLMMGAQLLEECRLAEIAKVVTLGTICSYPKFTPVPFHEEAIWDGYPEETNAPYGLAKKMLLVQGQAYRQQYGMNVIHLLAVNLYGPRDNFDPITSHVIPALIAKFDTAIRTGADGVELWGSGGASREFLYVEDAAAALRMATEQYDEAGPVNVGAGFEISIRELASLIADLMGFTGEVRWDTSKPDGQPRRCLDTAKAERLFGFRARTTLEEGLTRTIEWYRASQPPLPETAQTVGHRRSRSSTFGG